LLGFKPIRASYLRNLAEPRKGLPEGDKGDRLGDKKDLHLVEAVPDR
jgi:hypothetical protein